MKQNIDKNRQLNCSIVLNIDSILKYIRKYQNFKYLYVFQKPDSNSNFRKLVEITP